MTTQNYKDTNDVGKLKNIIHNYESEVRILQEQIKCLTDKIYGRKSEKILNNFNYLIFLNLNFLLLMNLKR